MKTSHSDTGRGSLKRSRKPRQAVCPPWMIEQVRKLREQAIRGTGANPLTSPAVKEPDQE